MEREFRKKFVGTTEHMAEREGRLQHVFCCRDWDETGKLDVE
jgi:hypothetical protein